MRHSLLVIVMLCVLLVSACNSQVTALQKTVVGGDANAGRAALEAYGCGACHNIPGVQNAVSYVGPPLNEFEQRHYIAGNLPNTADNLIYWIMYPQSVEPGTAMPNLNVTENDARNMAAYLYGS
jgi:cytochrome c